MARRKKMTGKKYVLYGCPIDLSQRYEIKGYIGTLSDGTIGLVNSRDSAFTYTDDKESGHGTPEDWVKLFKEDYGLNVHPIFLKSQ